MTTTSGYQNLFGGYSSYGQGQAQINQYLMNLQGQLQQGIIPSLGSLFNERPALEPESPAAQLLQARTLFLLQQAGPQGQERAKQLALKVSNQQLDHISGSLSTVAANLEPASPEAQQLEARRAAQRSIEMQINKLLNESLDQDPSHGGEIRLNQGNAGGNNDIRSIISQMLEMMTSLFKNHYGEDACPGA